MNDTPLSLPDLLARTPARVLAGRSGSSYRTATALKLREDHAAAQDAVHAELDLNRDFGPLVEKHGLFEVRTRANTKAEYLRRPDLGRRLSPESVELIRANCEPNVELQIVIGDGLSATAATVQAPVLLEKLISTVVRHSVAGAAGTYGEAPKPSLDSPNSPAPPATEWRTTVRPSAVGRPFVIHHCRVGVMNEIGDVLSPEVLVLLVGERPGLATAESLSAYLAYKPRTGHTDANRNLVSNIHARGVGLDDAADRILKLAAAMRSLGRSGTGLTEAQYTPPSTCVAAAPAVPPP
jgi:ethanolamine ammonia-lyase small subunit